MPTVMYAKSIPLTSLYFDLGQGKDYVYHGKTFFRGLHVPEDVLQLSVRQKSYLQAKKPVIYFQNIMS